MRNNMRKEKLNIKATIITVMLFSAGLSGCAQNTADEATNPYYKTLTPEEKWVIVNKGTERPFTGKYDEFFEAGIYVCKRCGAELYRSSDKFNSGCGWPSFDDEVPGAVKRTPDPDGMRTEITCSNCGAHLGHVFLNEGFTDKNTRHCVNSISLQFIPARTDRNAGTDTAYFAGGCFWGVEYYMEQAPGVLSVESGYMGGKTKDPSYSEVSSHRTGHAETVQVVFDPSKTDYEALAKLFFEIHDPTQMNRQGPDVGNQYRSEVFYRSVEQKETAEKLVSQLKKNGYQVVTLITPVRSFWEAEGYHQDYYGKNGGTPYCHMRVDRFSGQMH
jgi:peptide methionine sulfoxide reductase msrA/msrB